MELGNGVVLVDPVWNWVVGLGMCLWQLLGAEGRKGALPYITGELGECQASISKRNG